MESIERIWFYWVLKVWILYMDIYIIFNYNYFKVKGCFERGNCYSKRDRKYFFLLFEEIEIFVFFVFW